MRYRVAGMTAVLAFSLTVCAFAQAGQPGQGPPPAAPGGAQAPAAQGGQQGGQRGQGGGGQGGGRGQPAGPARPTPRLADGRVDMGALPGETGLWLPAGGGGERFVNADTTAAAVGKLKESEVPFQPWAKALYQYRAENQLEPHTRCKPSGGPRQFLTPYGVEFVDLPELKRFFIVDLGGPHSFRMVYMDGRTHPKDLVPSYYGHSIGRWDGDTLVVETVGFNERFWIDRVGSPHTEKLVMTERLTRTDMNTIKYEAVIDDPGAYTATWTSGFNLRWTPGSELFEYVCQDNNFAADLMVGAQESVDRSTPIVP